MYTLIHISFPLMTQFQTKTKEELQAIIDKHEFKRCDCQIYRQGDSKNAITSEFKFKSNY